MTRTAALFAVGAAAICGLPPLNGFVSELLIYVGLLRINTDGIDGAWSVAPLAAPLLAMAGALAIACFVKAFGTVFLGPDRSGHAARAHDSPPAMLLGMGLLALGCIGIGALPALVMPALDPVVRSWVRLDPPPPPLGELVPWHAVMGMNAVLVGGVLTGALLLGSRARRRPPALAVTWDCGYARPGPTMAYTASSFAQILTRLFHWVLQPRFGDAVSRDLFPPRRSFHTAVPEQVLDGVLTPLWARFRRTLVPLRAVQHGRVQQYLMYVLLTLCILLASLAPIDELLVQLLGW
jgi:hydrogenase-4 component B